VSFAVLWTGFHTGAKVDTNFCDRKVSLNVEKAKFHDIFELLQSTVSLSVYEIFLKILFCLMLSVYSEKLTPVKQ
jgi:hypothetical protein